MGEGAYFFVQIRNE